MLWFVMENAVRMLGHTSVSVHPVGLGCMGMSEFYGPSESESASIQVIHRALEMGANFLDTADMYGRGHNEELVGKALKGKREQAVLATKFGIRRGADGEFLGISGRPEYVRAACDASLKRLQVETIDLYYQHRVDPTVPIEDTVGAMAELVKEGKVRYLGLSEVGEKTLERAHAVHPITAVQNELSLWSRDYETTVVGVCERLGISFVAYSPLGRGFLTGQIKKFEDLAHDDWRRNNPRFMGDAFKRNLQVVDRLKAWAEKKNVTTAQLALAWVLSRGSRVLSIPGTRSIRRLEENLKSVDVGLSASQFAELDSLLPPDTFVGTRYPPASMSTLNA